MQISQFTDKPIDQEAIELLQACEPPEGYYLGNSGGKDSAVCENLLRRAGVRFDAHYCVSPIDPPQVREHLKRYYPETIWEYHARGFFQKILTHGMPNRKRRWCCEYIKEAGGAGRVKVLGMRRIESGTRKSYKCLQDNPRLGMLVLPIVGWSDADVWQYIYENHLPANPLYKFGFSRIGCILCPYCGQDEIKQSLVLFPRVVNCWRMASDRFFADRIKRGKPLKRFKTSDELWAWFIARPKRRTSRRTGVCRK